MYASLDRDLSGEKNGRNGRHPQPDPASLIGTFGRLGIDGSVQVVAYDQDTGMYASRLWWLLRWLGHDAVAVLDGGFARWQAEQRPVRSGVETRTPRAFSGAPRAGWMVNADEVGRVVATGDSLLVDARSPERYRGESETLDRVAGHIPGAVNHFFKWNLSDEGTFRTPEEIRERLRASIGDAATRADHLLLRVRRDGLPQSPRLRARRPRREPPVCRIVERVVERPVSTG